MPSSIRPTLLLIGAIIWLLASAGSLGASSRMADTPIPMRGTFFNTGAKAGGVASGTLLVTEETIAGSLNLTEYARATHVLCGAGSFSGPRSSAPQQYTFVSQDVDPRCGFDWEAIFTITATLDMDGNHFWGTYSAKNAGQSNVHEYSGVFELWASAYEPASTGYIGDFTNVSLGRSGTLSLDIIVGSATVAGYIDFSNHPGEQTLCGAGPFAGLMGAPYTATFISADPAPGCSAITSKFELMLSPSLDGSTIQGTYRVSSQVGVFTLQRATRIYIPLSQS